MLTSPAVQAGVRPVEGAEEDPRRATAAPPTASAACSPGGWSRPGRSSSTSTSPARSAATGQGWDYHGFHGERCDRPARRTAADHRPDAADAARRPGRARPARRRRWWCGSASSAARRGSTRTAAATTGRSATPRCSPAAARSAGYVYGASDKLGAYPTRRPGAARRTWRRRCSRRSASTRRRRSATSSNRPLPIARGKPIKEVFA